MILATSKISKRFGDTVALDGVDFSLKKGEVHALLGENGAGKTTLMNLFFGLHRPDSGKIFFDGKEARIKTPRSAIKRGISMVHQHFMLSPTLTVAENVALSLKKEKSVFFSIKRLNERIAALAEDFHFDLDPAVPVSELSVGEQQRVELLKAAARNCRVLILDEPTALLTPQEVEKLFQIFRKLNQAGVSIIFITHKLAEVGGLCHRVTLLRRGKIEGVHAVPELDLKELAVKLVGEGFKQEKLPEVETPAGETWIELKNVSALSDRKTKAIENIDLALRKKEVVGVVGVEGNGQKELAEVVRGRRKIIEGERKCSVARVGFIPSDRLSEGLVLPMSIEENLLLDPVFLRESCRNGFLKKRKISRVAKNLIRHYSIAAVNEKCPVETLSGGNQQKVVAARELALKPEGIVAVNPTWGLDLESTEYVHRQLLKLKKERTGILLVTIDIDEALKLSDRLFVLYKGGLVEIPREKQTPEKIGEAMLGFET